MPKVNFHAAIFLVVRDADDRILLHQRAGTEWLPGYWDFPSGHVEDNESFAVAAVRELAEETSLSVRQEDLEIIHVSINHTDEPYINVVFVARKWQGMPTITEPHKCSAMEFFAVNQLPEKLTLAVRNVLAAGFKPDLSGNVFVGHDQFAEIMGEEFKLY